MSEDLARWIGEQLDEDENEARRLYPSDTAVRLLREVEAKRRLLDEFSRTGAVPDTPERRASPTWKGDFGYLHGLARAVHLLAEVYDSRPGYREEWRP
jgi:hypothetical protein